MSGPAGVRRIGASDLEPELDALVALEAELFDDAWDAAALRGLITGHGRHLHVLRGSDGTLAGYVLTQTLGDFVDLLRIGVTASARRGGVAATLLAAAAARARDEGATRVLLEVSEANAGARAFYDRLGFVEIDRRPGYYRDGSDALVLEHSLTVQTAVPGIEPAGAGEGE